MMSRYNGITAGWRASAAEEINNLTGHDETAQTMTSVHVLTAPRWKGSTSWKSLHKQQRLTDTNRSVLCDAARTVPITAAVGELNMSVLDVCYIGKHEGVQNPQQWLEEVATNPNTAPVIDWFIAV